MQNTFTAVLDKAKQENSQTITDFQYIMAKETEGKELDTELVLKAVKYLNDNPDLGFFMVAFDPQNNKEIGTQLITYAHEVFLNKSVWWFQSVCVHQDYRGRGIFKQMFKDVERQVEQQKYPLKLYVETENERAQKVYQRMGMHDANEVYLEDDFFFEDKISFAKTDKYSYSLLDLTKDQDVEEVIQKVVTLKSECGYQQANQDQVRAGINHIKQYRAQGDIIRIHDKQTQALVGLVGLFYEFSDWRNGVIVYLSDIRFDEKVLPQSQEIYSGLFHWCKKEMETKIPLTCLRVIINENLPAVQVIKNSGMEQAHYRVYLKE